MFAVVADRAPVQKMTSLTMAPKPRLNFLSTLNLMDLEAGTLSVERLGRGFAWLDAGIFDSLLDASNFFRTIEQRQGLKVARVEEVAWRMGYIDSERFLRLAEAMPDGDYRRYVRGLIEPTGNS